MASAAQPVRPQAEQLAESVVLKLQEALCIEDVVLSGGGGARFAWARHDGYRSPPPPANPQGLFPEDEGTASFAPHVFHTLRGLFGVDNTEYVESLCGVLHPQGSGGGRSGASFFVSENDKFMLKAISARESDTLQVMLPDYVRFVHNNPDTLLPRFLGLFRLQLDAVWVNLVVMNNVFHSCVSLHAKYDLKGSTVHRIVCRDAILECKRKGQVCVLKDLNLDRTFCVGSLHSALMTRLRADAEFLQGQNIIDYSLLVGVHDSRAAHTLPAGRPWRGCLGGVQCRSLESHSGADTLLPEVLFLGIIDVLCTYDVSKRLESFAKTRVLLPIKAAVSGLLVGRDPRRAVQQCDVEISVVAPYEYLERFITFMSGVFVPSDGMADPRALAGERGVVGVPVVRAPPEENDSPPPTPPPASPPPPSNNPFWRAAQGAVPPDHQRPFQILDDGAVVL